MKRLIGAFTVFKAKRKSIEQMYRLYVWFYLFMAAFYIVLFVTGDVYFPPNPLGDSRTVSVVLFIIGYLAAVMINLAEQYWASKGIVTCLIIMHFIGFLLNVPLVFIAAATTIDLFMDIGFFFTTVFILNFRRVYLKELFLRVKDIENG